MGKRSGISLTKTEIQKIQPGPSIQRVWDLDTRGLGLQVTPAGVYSWVLSYRIHGRKDMATLGRWPAMTVDQARKAATARWAEIHAGVDPKQVKADKRKADEEARKAAVTVADLADRYLREHVQSTFKGQGAEARRLIRLHVLPALGKLPVAQVGSAHVSDMIYKLNETPVQANRVRGVMRTMFRRAEEWEYRALGTNPRGGGQKAQHGGQP